MSTKRLSKSDRTKITIESPLNEIMIGLLLGDGHIQKRSINGNSRFIYGQSSLRIHHYNYFYHILELFKPYISKEFIIKEKSFKDKRTNANYKSVNFATLSLPCFNYYKNIKIIDLYNNNNINFKNINTLLY